METRSTCVLTSFRCKINTDTQEMTVSLPTETNYSSAAHAVLLHASSFYPENQRPSLLSTAHPVQSTETQSSFSCG